MQLAQDAKDTLKRTPMIDGGSVDPWNPRPEDITIENIAWGLSRTARFCGQTPGEPYSVAQHSVYVARIVDPHRRLAALLHDASEYLTGDLPHHIKHGPGFLGMTWRGLDDPISAAIAERFGLEPEDLYDAAIKQADETIFNLEWASLVQLDPHPEFEIRAWDWDRARIEFLDSFARYTSG